MRGHLTHPRLVSCKGCHTSFETTVARKLFCSTLCKTRFTEKLRSAVSRRIHSLTCQFCAQPFKSKNKLAQFCSRSCLSRAGWQSGRLTVPRNTYFKPGSDHPQWKGFMRGYQITRAEYAALLAKQDGKCAICGICPEAKRLSIDHDHETGAVRGLLCNNCNFAIGLLRDSPALVSRAALYLAGHAVVRA